MFYRECKVEVRVYNYLDDFLVISSPARECEIALRTFEKLCRDLGSAVADHKTVRATTCLTLGLGINAKKLMLFIPKEKAEKAVTQVTDFLKRKTESERMAEDGRNSYPFSAGDSVK